MAQFISANDPSPAGAKNVPVVDRTGTALDELRQPSGYPNFQPLDQASTGGFDIYKYLRILVKYRWLILACAATTIAVVSVITFLMTPIYRATVSIQIDREAMRVVKVDGVEPNSEQVGNPEFYQTQYELLASRSLAERVIATAGLMNEPSFTRDQATLGNTLLNLVGLGPKPSAPGPATQDDKLRIVTEHLTKDITITPVRGSRIVRLSIDNPSPALAQRVANAYADAYIADNLDRRFDATSYARKFLEDRLQQLRVKLEESEKDLVKYAQDKGIINLDDDKSLSAADLESINTKLNDARNDRIKRELLWKQAQNTPGIALKEILDSPSVQENLKLKAKLESEYHEKLATFKPAFPMMVELRNQIKELDRQLQNDASAVKASIQAAYLASKEQESRLQAMLDSSKSEVSDLRNRNIQYNILKREVDTNRTLYDGLLQRYKEIGVAGGIGTNNLSVVDRATQPKFPRSPVIWLNIAIATLAGLLLGCLVALGLDFLDDTLKVPEDVERELGLPVIGVVPKPAPGSSIESELEDTRSGLAEAYRSLRTGMQFSTRDGLPRTLLLTSSKPSEGKTTTSINIAKTLSQIGLRILLIDGDLRNASLHRRLKLSNELGLSNYLTGNNQPEDVVRVTEDGRMVLMTSGPLPPNPAELLAGPKLPSLLALASESFDVVIIDGPPVIGLADAPILSSLVQATMMVVAAGETRRNVLRTALRRLNQAHANIVGVILNKFDLKMAAYGYGYGDYSYYTYGQDQELTKGGA